MNDFALAPDSLHKRKEVMLTSIEEVRRLWRGEPFTFKSPKGESASAPHPAPPDSIGAPHLANRFWQP